MTIARKPQSVDDFIHGSAVAAESVPTIESNADIQPVKLRLPKDLVREIDASRAERRPKPSRHQFILEALYEKLAVTAHKASN